ncbi:MAG: lysine--tRNA ligase [Bacillales bacterium]|jgi:lysyl-tRNA synthetase class 2|nr:lysine--tRNA ligase [Bacillales bacterium]
MRELTDQEINRLSKIDKLKELGIDPYGSKYEVNAYSLAIKNKYQGATHEEMEEKNIIVRVAGRIVLLRNMGKAAFFHIKDSQGTIQVYIRKDEVGDEQYDLFKLADLGDIVGIEGRIMVTNTGELSVRAKQFTHLTKALRPLPEKYHGLSDIEERYRRRYLDLISNDEALRIAFLRPKIVRGMQNYFDSLGFTEVETPVLQSIQGGATARPFVTHHNTLDLDLYLRIATELPLKRLLVGGMERVYEIGRLFRNEGMDPKHNPEFTTVELYQAYGDLKSMMEITEGVIKKLAKEVIKKDVYSFLGSEVDLIKPFEIVKMTDLIKKYTGVDFKNNNYSLKEAQELANKHKVPLEKHFTVGHIINAFFEEYCEKTLIQPTFVTEYPLEVSPLTKQSKEDARFVERFELFVCGAEIANAYTELNNPIEQRKRFEAQLKERDSGNDEAYQLDEDFVEALEYGMPPAGGVGMGIDRLAMLLLEVDSVREVILFPQMKDRQQ